MHPIDRLLFDGNVLARELGKPLPKAGDSFWGDAMRELFEVVAWVDLPTQAVALARSLVCEEASRYEAASSPP